MELNTITNEIDEDKQKKAKELAKTSRIIEIGEMIFSFIYFIIAIFSGLSVNIRDFAISSTDIWFFQISLFCMILFQRIKMCLDQVTV